MKILLLTDGSACSQKAAVQAVAYAKKWDDAEIVVYTVIDPKEAKALSFNLCMASGMCDQMKDHEEKIRIDMKKSMLGVHQDLVRQIAEVGIAVRSHSTEGPILNEIIREISEGGYDLVVMGAYGKDAKQTVSNLFVEIVRCVDVPVLIAR